MNYRNIIKFDEIDSTNRYAMKNIDILSDRTIIIAQKQTAGKGRFDRRWVSSSAENVYMSIVLKPCNKIAPDIPLANITQYMSVVVSKVLEKYGVKPQIKWPNDVMINNKKIAGILSELSTTGSVLNGLVIGVGVNLNLDLDYIKSIDKPATALNLEINKEIDKTIFVELLLNEFFKDYEAFLKIGFPFIKESYEKRCMFLDKEIEILNGEKLIKGTVLKINANGTLMLLDKANQEILINSGDVLF